MDTTATVLVFQEHHLDITDIRGEPWLRGFQIGSALGYQNPRADIANLYNRNADEFDETMTQVIKLPDLRLQSASAGIEEGQMRETRIFSLRGCHLLGMLAKTEPAKAFRRWVLDVLQEYGERAKAAAAAVVSEEQCQQIRAEVHLLSQRTGEPQQSVYARLFADFGVRSSSQIRAADFATALAFLQDPPQPYPWLPQLDEDDVLYLQRFPQDVVLRGICDKNRHLVNAARLAGRQLAALRSEV